ncbi:hypothetical protein DFH09DRAFT_91246 [Mycena vulgaris]|nr:hypothetical protein DFH09DRAFT_91246 [Mycena vulgaris]
MPPPSLSFLPQQALPISPSPSPPSDHPHPHALFAAEMQLLHPHPSLLYHPAFDYSLPAGDESPPTGSAGGAGGKRYRSAPPKTFQCAGYGECRMVFSRSEHLARHIRKHTGERPFACHCTKQFSRLDNLRQHAQTVHSAPEDKPLNERMMRALAGVNASMMAGVRSTHSHQHSYPQHSSQHRRSPFPSPHQQYSGGGEFPFGSGSASLPNSPTAAAFPTSGSPPYPSPAFSPSMYAYRASPLGSPAAVAFEAADYLSAGAAGAQQAQGEVYVKQESDADAIYAALAAPPSHAHQSSHHSHQSHGHGHQLMSYASSSSLSSHSSASTSASSSSHYDARGRGSPHSSPPCSPTFWGTQAQQQGQRGGAQEYLPSPPQSPPYYASSHPHPSMHQAQQQEYAPYAWPVEEEQGGEMSNAQYYAALQHQSQHAQQQSQSQQQQGEWHGGVYA